METFKRIYNALNEFLTNNFNREIVRTSPKEAIVFAKKYFRNKRICVAEIGVFFGKTARDMNNNLNIKKLYLIDPYLRYEDYKEDTSGLRLKEARKNSHKINKSKNIIWIEKLSEDAVKKIKEDLDFLYIDGNHEYSYVKKDLELYWDKIKKGGIISGHDIQGIGVSKALIEFVKKKNLEVRFGDRRDWWIIKK